jgi:hypothetical protein
MTAMCSADMARFVCLLPFRQAHTVAKDLGRDLVSSEQGFSGDGSADVARDAEDCALHESHLRALLWFECRHSPTVRGYGMGRTRMPTARRKSKTAHHSANDRDTTLSARRWAKSQAAWPNQPAATT